MLKQQMRFKRQMMVTILIRALVTDFNTAFVRRCEQLLTVFRVPAHWRAPLYSIRPCRNLWWLRRRLITLAFTPALCWRPLDGII